jgi:hypothetical protein
MMLQLESRLGQSPGAQSRPSKGGRLKVVDFAGRTWVTRKGIYVDRIACAWLIRRFIDPQARFRFVPGKNYKLKRAEVRFDMFDGEFSHEGDLCSFEVFVKRFFPKDRALEEISWIVHDLDLKDGKFRKPETAGLGSLIAGLAATTKTDAERLERGAAIFDHLYAYFSRN